MPSSHVVYEGIEEVKNNLKVFLFLLSLKLLDKILVYFNHCYIFFCTLINVTHIKRAPLVNSLKFYIFLLIIIIIIVRY